MTRDDARLRRLLEQEKNRLLEDISTLQKRETIEISASNHMADIATEAFEQASGNALLQQAQHRLKRIDHALSKFAAGTYGYCEGCGEPIDFARLKALPDARFCLHCQRKRETNGSLPPGPRAMEQGKINNQNGKANRPS